MTLYFIGLGLADETDITLKGAEAIKKCFSVYLESYTSILQVDTKKLEQLHRKTIILANRKMVEKQAEKTILADAKKHDTAFLVIGDPFSATTHVDLFQRAKKEKIPVTIIHNTSIMNAVGEVGLELYKYGKTTSIPFPEKSFEPETPYNVILENKKRGLHTLVLLDLRPDENRFMSVADALSYLTSIEGRRKENAVTAKTLVVGCARMGSDKPSIFFGTAEKVIKTDFGKPPHCLIIPGKLHFMEEEMVERYSVK